MTVLENLLLGARPAAADSLRGALAGCAGLEGVGTHPGGEGPGAVGALWAVLTGRPVCRRAQRWQKRLVEISGTNE